MSRSPNWRLKVGSYGGKRITMFQVGDMVLHGELRGTVEAVTDGLVRVNFGSSARVFHPEELTRYQPYKDYAPSSLPPRTTGRPNGRISVQAAVHEIVVMAEEPLTREEIWRRAQNKGAISNAGHPLNIVTSALSSHPDLEPTGDGRWRWTGHNTVGGVFADQLADSKLEEDVLDAVSTAIEELPEKNPAAVELGHLGGLKGGKARAEALSPEQRSDIARSAANTRWGEEKPKMGRPRKVKPETELAIAVAHTNGEGSERQLAEQFGIKKGVVEQAIKRIDLENRGALAIFEGELAGALQEVAKAETELAIADARLLGIRERMAEQGFSLVRESHFNPEPIRKLLNETIAQVIEMAREWFDEPDEMSGFLQNGLDFYRGLHMLEELLGCKLWEGESKDIIGELEEAMTKKDNQA